MSFHYPQRRADQCILRHLSDTHIGADPAHAERLAWIVRQTAAEWRAGEPIALLVTGDLTHNGDADEWAALYEAFAAARASGLRVFGCLGNHDVARLGLGFNDERAARARSELARIVTPPERELRGLMVWYWGHHKIVALDSTRGEAPLARGCLGASQLAALEVELQDPEPHVIALHHHPTWPDEAHLLTDRRALMALIDRRPDRVPLVCHGHKHESRVLTVGKTRYIASGATTQAVEGELRLRDLVLWSVPEIIERRYPVYTVKPAP